MDYPKANNEIRAGFAKRIGEIIGQYSEFQEKEDKKYEITLSIMALQSLSTLCESLIEKKPELLEGPFSEKISDEPGFLGVCNEHIKLNTFPHKVTNYEFMNHIRNAMCHPINMTKTLSLFSETGFYANSTPNTEKIESFCFFERQSSHSKTFKGHKEEEAKKICKSIKDSSSYFCEKAERIKVESNFNDLFDLVLLPGQGKYPRTIPRIFYVELSPKTISKLVKNLSHILSKDLTVAETREFACPDFY